MLLLRLVRHIFCNLSRAIYTEDVDIFLFDQLNVMLNAEISANDRECLDEFVQVRHSLCYDIDMSAKEEDALVHYVSNEVEEMSTHELLIAEVRTQQE